MAEEQKPRCSGCSHAIIQITGYSEWTIDGAEIRCSKELNPRSSFDDDSKEDDAFAEQCGSYSPGDATQLDYDGNPY